MSDAYEGVNAVWPTVIPPITRVEATRASRKLYAHFAPTRWKRWKPKPRKVWVSLDPKRCGLLTRGWRRLVHDVSHQVFEMDHKNLRPGRHGDNHARLELEMAQYVMAKGWLDGALKLAPKAPVVVTPSDKLAKVQARIARWESKRKRALTALAKLHRQERHYLRRQASASHQSGFPW